MQHEKIKFDSSKQTNEKIKPTPALIIGYPHVFIYFFGASERPLRKQTELHISIYLQDLPFGSGIIFNQSVCTPPSLPTEINRDSSKKNV